MLQLFAFSKLSPEGPQLQLPPSVQAGGIFPCDFHGPLSHLALVAEFKDDAQVLLKSPWAGSCAGSSASASSYKGICTFHSNMTCHDVSFISQKTRIFRTLFLFFSLPPGCQKVGVNSSGISSSSVSLKPFRAHCCLLLLLGSLTEQRVEEET